MTRLVLDLSRTLSRAIHSVPTGIDRVEMAYAEGLLTRAGDRLDFAAVHPLGRFGLLPRKAAEAFLALTALRWRHGAEDDGAAARAARGLLRSVLLGGDLLSAARLRRNKAQAAYLLMSHHHLDRPAAIETATRGGKLSFICLVHDLIPLEFQEYARSAEPARHQRRIETVARLADGVVVNSNATHRSLQPWLEPTRPVPVLVAPLGADVQPAPAASPGMEGDDRPYFVFLGTIEPRKNHLLALHVWRRLATELGPLAPRLLLIGRRGWEVEQVINLVERCEPLRGLVVEQGNLPDRDALALMRGARALILPSFAEGYGLPVAEALAHGVPVLCSDLPAFREVGQDVPEYFDPVDGLAWLRAVQDYSIAGSVRRAAQLARLRHWHPPSWSEHVAAAIDFTDEVSQRRGGRAPALDTGPGQGGPELTTPMVMPSSICACEAAMEAS